mgnify:FL=1
MERLTLVILGCAVVTFLPRFLPMYILTRLKIPKVVVAWLSYIPVAVLAALVVPGIMAPEHKINLTFTNAYFIAAFPAFFIAWRTKNMLLTVVGGMAVVFLLQYL